MQRSQQPTAISTMKSLVTFLVLYALCFMAIMITWRDDMVGVPVWNDAVDATGADIKSIASWLADSKATLPNRNKKKNEMKHHSNPPYAYSYVLGGCDPDLAKYRPYLYGVFVSAYILRQLGSKSDM